MGPISTLSDKQLRTRALTLLRVDLMARSKDIERIHRGIIRGQTNPFFLPDGRMGLRFLRPKGLHGSWEWADGVHSVAFYVAPYAADERICTVSNVSAYLSRVQNTDGPLCRGLTRGQKPIKASTLSSIVRDQILGPDGAAINAWVKREPPR